MEEKRNFLGGELRPKCTQQNSDAIFTDHFSYSLYISQTGIDMEAEKNVI